ncbi:hypothetical protein PISMIDRAFT_672988 [Pisolithus microcarpus 441]|uniref:Uncharacterized protein n=1 Tax=Pisolithus microcarpus 441 TaxID=765257 RepID=A0A0C9ZRT1_9AGAM|nr:hypothetical protein BKA83DRAFT_672988 [Pisolithus microcarpus]KIK28789.1 hypothetical protein PISMIDRAFT_672988 [Pisolithus microcarpus 441]
MNSRLDGWWIQPSYPLSLVWLVSLGGDARRGHHSSTPSLSECTDRTLWSYPAKMVVSPHCCYEVPPLLAATTLLHDLIKQAPAPVPFIARTRAQAFAQS